MDIDQFPPVDTGGVVDDTNGGLSDVFVGRGDEPADLVSINAAGTGTGDGPSREPVISRDGRHVVFVSAATDLVPDATDTNGFDDVFVRDLRAGTTTLVSRSRTTPDSLSTGDLGSPPAFLLDEENLSGPAISDDGRFIVF